MAILKNKTQGNFVIISQNIAHDNTLGLTERGLLLSLLSLPDGWNLSVSGLTHILPDGKDKVSKALNTLIELGYVTRDQERSDNGKFGSNVLEVHEIPMREDLPLTGFPSTVKPQTDKPSAEKPSQLNNKYITNNKLNNKESVETHTLTDSEYESLVEEYGKDLVDYQINRIKDKNYTGYMNYISIKQWCNESKARTGTNNKKNPSNTNSYNKGNYDWDELEKELLKGDS